MCCLIVRWSTAFLWGVALLVPTNLPAAEPTSALELLPSTSVVYFSLPAPDQLASLVAEHPTFRQLQQMPIYQYATGTPKYEQFQTVLHFVETRIGMDWKTALAVLGDSGVHVAIDAPTEGLVVLLETSQPERRQELLREVIQLAREDAESKGKDDPFEVSEYRGLKALRADDTIVATLGRWLMVTNKKATAQQVADRFLDGNEANLQQENAFQQAAARAGDSLAWGYVDIATLRQAGVAKDLFREQSKDFGAELILGGITANLIRTDHLLAKLDLDNESLRLSVQTPHDPAWIPAAREFYWGASSSGAAPAALPPQPNQLFSLGTYRDLSSLWLRAGDLFGPKVVDELANADSGLSNLFGGRDFGEDILGAFEPGMQFVAVRQDYDPLTQTPAIRLPGFAIVLQLKDADTMRPELRRTFQSLIGFLNIVGASQGNPQLDMTMGSSDGAEYVFAKYLPESRKQPQTDGPMHYNFSPSIVFRDNRCVIASTAELATQLSKLEATSTPDPQHRNLWLELTAPTLRSVLIDNRETLVSQNQLEKGHTQQEAEAEIDTLMTLLDLFRAATVETGVEDGYMSLKAAVSFKTPGHPPLAPGESRTTERRGPTD